MTKKSFKTGFDSLLCESREEAHSYSPPKKENKPLETRATLIVESELFKSIKAISYWERKKIKDVVNESFKDYVEKYIARNKELKDIPQ